MLNNKCMRILYKIKVYIHRVFLYLKILIQSLSICLIFLLDKMDMAFGDNFVNEQEVDPVAEFVAREQDQLAGLENEIPPVAMSAPTMASNIDGS